MTRAEPAIDALFARIAAALAGEGTPSSDFDLNDDAHLAGQVKTREAGVLCAIEVIGGRPFVILTMRSSRLKHHPGQIAFPGGKLDPGDATVTDAALREAREEIGLPPDHVALLGTLPSHVTVTGFRVTPIVARITGPFTVIPEPGEVAEVFRVPLDHLLNPDNYAIQGRRWRGTMRQYYTVPWGPYYVWGATARMLYTFARAMQG